MRPPPLGTRLMDPYFGISKLSDHKLWPLHGMPLLGYHCDANSHPSENNLVSIIFLSFYNYYKSSKHKIKFRNSHKKISICKDLFRKNLSFLQTNNSRENFWSTNYTDYTVILTCFIQYTLFCAAKCTNSALI